MELDDIDAGLIDQMASQQMGVTPQQAAAPQVSAPAQQPTPQSKPTAQEQASAAVAPNTEGTKTNADPFEFFDAGNGRMYTPDQLRGITSRYTDLNRRHQTEVAPVQKTLSFINQLRQQAAADGTTLDDEQLASILEASLTAYASNPTIGNKGQQQPNSQPGRTDVPIDTQTGTVDPNNMEAALSQWEQQNAVSLPPMYKDAIAKTGSLEQQIAQLTQMVQSLTQTGAQTAQTAENQLTQAKQANADAGKQQVVNNLQKIQNKFQFPDDAEKDFMAFVQGRGYDVWELMDYTLAETLATDFKNNMQAPDLERFRQMAERRQAFTGNLSPSPGAAPATSQQTTDPDMETINGMTDTIMKQRHMM